MWLGERQRIWPRTQNRQVLVSAVTATGTAAVSDYYLSWHLLLRGVQLEQIRGDLGLHEALAVWADRMMPGGVFHLGTATAIAHADIAHTLLERVCRVAPGRPMTRARQRDPEVHAVPRRAVGSTGRDHAGMRWGSL